MSSTRRPSSPQLRIAAGLDIDGAEDMTDGSTGSESLSRMKRRHAAERLAHHGAQLIRTSGIKSGSIVRYDDCRWEVVSINAKCVTLTSLQGTSRNIRICPIDWDTRTILVTLTLERPAKFADDDTFVIADAQAA